MYLNTLQVVLLSMDSFYKSLSPDQIAAAHRKYVTDCNLYKNLIEYNNSEYDFDHPNAFDFNALYETLLNLKKGNRVEVPIYDFATHSRYVRIL